MNASMRSRAVAAMSERKSMPSTHKKVIVRKLDRDGKSVV